MRIAICNGLYPTPDEPMIFGGAEVFARQLAERLVEDGHQIIVLRASLNGERRQETVNGVTIHFIPVRNLFPPFQDRRNPLMRLAWHAIDDRSTGDRSVYEILAAFKPDLMHSNTLNGLGTAPWLAAEKLDIPIVHTLHDYYLTCPRCSRFKDGAICRDSCSPCRALTGQRRERTHLVRAVTGVSQRILDIHHENGVFTKGVETHVVRNAPNPKIVPSPQPERGEKLVIGYLGRFSEEKGVRLLVDAVRRLAPGSVRLVLAGKVSDEERATLKAAAPDADMEFLGFVDPSTFYQTVDIVTVPSIWHEPGPLSLLDALAAGRPSIGTPFGGIPEAIIDGVTGWVAEPTPEGLAKTIAMLAANPEKIDSAHSALTERQGRHRTFDDVVNEYTTIYRSVLDRTATTPKAIVGA